MFATFITLLGIMVGVPLLFLAGLVILFVYMPVLRFLLVFLLIFAGVMIYKAEQNSVYKSVLQQNR